jgi:hypothetical protein
MNDKGVRGAVLLLEGRHFVAGSVRLHASGVVLRGQNGATLVAAGIERRALVEIKGKADRTLLGAPTRITDAYVPSGSRQVRVADSSGLKKGDSVIVTHPSTKRWIAALGMDRFPARDKGSYLDWIPGKMDVHFDRTITDVQGDTITLDARLTMALDAQIATCTLQAYRWSGRIDNVGVENLRLESEYDRKNPKDEEHAWDGVHIENARDVWVRKVSTQHFAGSAVYVASSCRRLTVEDCESRAPVSEIAGYRRHTFYTAGQQTLFRRCQAHDGRHDFAVGYLAAGPNVFTECKAERAHQFSGPIESWATGVLYDRVVIDGAGLALTNRETEHQGVGWAAANSVQWQCTAPLITCRMPPTAQNWSIGCWGQFVGDGHWRSMNQFFKPDSLFAAQLTDRLGQRAGDAAPILTERGAAKSIDELMPAQPPLNRTVTADRSLALKNGWLMCGDTLLTGTRASTTWWRGHLLPARAPTFGLGLTRFVPSQSGPGYTDDLDELTSAMQVKGQTILEHHWGLWYDRRRDDHNMFRRPDAEVWAPFYEQPWARSGQRQAWDGLSKYDLTKFNPWYFNRLKTFARLARQKGLMLVQQMYFQHNLLEAGAHWADFAWRPANCLQDTGFPEPPPYENNKRVFMAKAFYDVEHPMRRELHRAYIRHCLDVLGNEPNVLFQTGEEFTGPLPFVEFWLDTIADWQKEKGRKVLVGLSCTKDVQDAILRDAKRAPLVSVIDLRYWWYTANGGVFDPKGGESLAPRQQLREWKGSKSRSDASLARAVREYRLRFPDKAVLCSLEPNNSWAILTAGGSASHLPAIADKRLKAALPRLQPLEMATLADNQWGCADVGRDYLIYALSSREIRLDLTPQAGAYEAVWITPKTGAMTRRPGEIAGGDVVTLRTPDAGSTVLWLTRKSKAPARP